MVKLQFIFRVAFIIIFTFILEKRCLVVFTKPYVKQGKQTAVITSSAVSDNSAYELFRTFTKMTQFYSTNNNSIFYKFAYINITVSFDDNSSCSLVIKLNLPCMSEACSDSLNPKIEKAHNVTTSFRY